MLKLWSLSILIALAWAKKNQPLVLQVTSPIDLGESPTWDDRNGLLYYVDVTAGTIYSHEYGSEEINSVTFDGFLTTIVPCKQENMLILGLDRSVVALEWDGRKNIGKQKVLTTVSPQFPSSRLNDGKADTRGRLWFGTMGFENATAFEENQGILYKITRENLDNPTPMIAPVNVSNGLAWNKKNNKFYYVDSACQNVVEYDYNDKKGEIKNKRVVFDVTEHAGISGFPDGMTIDKDDNLWVALFDGGVVVKVNPKTRKLLQVIPIPATAVTSVTWGGANLDILYVTTSRNTLVEEVRKQQPSAGAVFAVTGLGTHGFPPFRADIVDSI